tara:strand:- start:161 stop:427 length:267 start_codon:yes stop_codon:yes gene_type:complete
MKVGDVVFNNYHGIRRYGVVTEKFMKNKWVHVKVQWALDDVYERAMTWREEMGQGDRRLREYRIDQVKKIDIQRELKQLFLCLELSDS